MANYGRTSGAKLKALLNKAAFNKGYQEAKQGLPLDPDWGNSINEQWNYERGRLFAICYDDKIKINRRVSHRAIHSLNNAIYEGAII